MHDTPAAGHTAPRVSRAGLSRSPRRFAYPGVRQSAPHAASSSKAPRGPLARWSACSDQYGAYRIDLDQVSACRVESCASPPPSAPLRICMADLESCQCQRRDWRRHPHRAKLDLAGAMKAAACWRCRNNGCQETIVCAPTYAAEAGPMTPRVPRPGGSTVRATDATPLFGRPPVRQDVRDACHPVAALRAWRHSPWPDTGWRPERSH